EPTRPSGRQTCAALSTRARVSAEIRRHQETRSDVQIYEVCEQLGSTGESTLESCDPRTSDPLFTSSSARHFIQYDSNGTFRPPHVTPTPMALTSTTGLSAPKPFHGDQSIQNQGDAANHQPAKYDLLSSVPVITDLDLKFQYRGRTAGSLTPNPEQVDLFGPVSCSRCVSRGRLRSRTRSSGSTRRPCWTVKCSGLDRARWNTVHEPLEREKKIKVFSLNEFLQELILFHKGETQSPPPFEISFCFGEDWPDKKPEKRNSSWSGVVPVVARILTEMFSGELSWSTDSIRLLQSQHIQGPWTPPSLNTWTLFSPD
uniref:Interferon regulatory factor 5 n=1 Tax=Labrus bergylta TaxID=56723 RepID=A0A3Q3EUI9_9LABR